MILSPPCSTTRRVVILLILLGCSSTSRRHHSALAFQGVAAVTGPPSTLFLSSSCRRRRCSHRQQDIRNNSGNIHNSDKNDINKNDNHHHHSRSWMMMTSEDDLVDNDSANIANSNVSASSNTNTEELAFLLPGQSLRIRIGDTNASRKAWKKRRRNASPILIPASILDAVPRRVLVRWNVYALICLVGEEVIDPNGLGENRLLLGTTAGKLGRAYKRVLRGDLRRHAIDMGHDSIESLLSSLFDEGMDAGNHRYCLANDKENHGIVRTFVEPRHGNLVVGTTSLSRRQGRAMAASAGLVQFQLVDRANNDDYSQNSEKQVTMEHTGMAIPRLPLGKSTSSTILSSPEPLGAALRVYDGAIARRYQEGDEIDAVVHSYDDRGDGGGPLLVFTMARDPQGRGQGVGVGATSSSTSSSSPVPHVVGRVYSSNRNTHNISGVDDAGVERELTELKAGDGPFDATVVAVSSRSGAAFVDCGVGRRRGKKYGGGLTRVLGMLRFEDGATIDDGDDDGVMMIKSDDFDVEAGDEIQVYIRAVSPQSGRFMVTLDPRIKDKKAKDIKLEKRADKRKERLLSKKIRQDDIQNLIGKEFDGIIKAKSKVGSWYYVQPLVEGKETTNIPSFDATLPVGVANASIKITGGEDDSGSSQYDSYSVGDHVRVRLEGIDEMRGQLSLTLLD